MFFQNKFDTDSNLHCIVSFLLVTTYPEKPSNFCEYKLIVTKINRKRAKFFIIQLALYPLNASLSQKARQQNVLYFLLFQENERDIRTRL